MTIKRILTLAATLAFLVGCPGPKEDPAEPVAPTQDHPTYPPDYQTDVIEQQEAQKALEEATPKD